MDHAISKIALWNVDLGGAFYFYPVERELLIADCEAGRFADWIGRTYGARLVLDDSFMPRTLLDSLEGSFDATLVENVAIANADGFSWDVSAEFDYYGENFYTIDGFRAVVESFRAESGQDVFCMALAAMLDTVAEEAGHLNERSPQSQFGVMITGP